MPSRLALKRGAILCGISDYDDDRYGRLPHVRVQTDRLERLLCQELDPEFRYETVRRLHTDEASPTALERELLRLASMRGLDEVIVYLAGHGDLRMGRLPTFVTRGISPHFRLDEIIHLVETIPASRKYVLLDFCYAAAVMDSMLPLDWIPASKDTIAILAAAAGDQVTDAAGTFSNALIEALMRQSTRPDGMVLWSDVLESIYEAKDRNPWGHPVLRVPDALRRVPVNRTPAASPRPPAPAGHRLGILSPGVEIEAYEQIGHTEIVRTCRARLCTGGTAVVLRGGIPGLGKTTLAKRVVESLVEELGSNIYWIDCAHLDYRSALDELARALVPAWAGDEVTSEGTLFLRVAVELRARRALVVLDDLVPESPYVRFLSIGGSTSVLATTRYDLRPAVTADLELKVEPLAAADAELLLRTRAPGPTAGRDVGQLLAHLGGLPLAIHLTADTLEDSGIDLNEFSGDLDRSGILKLLGGDRSPVVRAFARVHDALDSSTRDVFRHLWSEDYSPPTPDRLRWSTGSDSWTAEILALHRHGLLGKPLPRSKDMPFHVHPLLAEYAGILLRKSGDWADVQSRVAQGYRREISVYDRSRNSFVLGGEPAARDCLPGLQAFWAHVRAADWQEAEAVLVAIADGLCFYSRQRELEEGIRKLESSGETLHPWLRLYRIEIARRNGDHPASALGDLQKLTEEADRSIRAAAWVDIGRLHTRTLAFEPARHAFEQALHGAVTTESDLRRQAVVHNELGRLMLKEGRPPEDALQEHRMALGLQERVSDRRGMAYSHHRIARLLLEHKNDDEGAAQEYRLAHDYARECGSASIVARSLAGLGRIALRHGEPENAMGYVEEAISSARVTGNAALLARLLMDRAAIEIRLEQESRALATAGQARQLVISDDIFGLLRKCDRFCNELRDCIAGLHTELADAEAELDRLSARGPGTRPRRETKSRRRTLKLKIAGLKARVSPAETPS